jgi:hypothetical protein
VLERLEEWKLDVAGAKADAPTARRAVIPKANFIFKRVYFGRIKNGTFRTDPIIGQFRCD